MKYLKYLVLVPVWYSQLYPCLDKSFMTYRSQGFNYAQQNSGWLRKCTDHHASVAVEYSQSFDSKAISRYFFGCDTLIFSGSRVSNRGPYDILADYFGLSTDFQSTLSFSPHIKNVITNFDFYWLLGCKDSGLNLRVILPLAHTKWALNPCETVLNEGSLDYPAGYMSNALIEHAQMKQGALDVLSGEQVFGDLSLPLQYGRIKRCTQSATKLADIYVALGYNIFCKPCGTLDVNVQVVVPTGTCSKAINLFEPQVGNGRHWALGLGILGQYDMFDNDDLMLSACIDARIQHLFKSTQKRTYDLRANGPGSRYMLLMSMIDHQTMTQGFSPTPGQDVMNDQYATRLYYAADVTTLDSTIKIDFQADIVAKLLATYRKWNFEIGYNLWARSREKLACRETLQPNMYSIKGDAQLYGFLDIGFQIPLPLNATQSQATIHAPQGNGNTTDNFVNNNADNPALMYNVGIPIAQTTPDSLSNTGATFLEQVNGSDQAILMSDCDINICSGLSPRALSHKIFGAIRYEFESHRCVNPYILVGAEGEFSGKTDGVKTAISQWGVWIKGGINY